MPREAEPFPPCPPGENHSGAGGSRQIDWQALAVVARCERDDAHAATLRAERDRYRAALIQCATIAGADVSDGVPSWPDVAAWAVQEVQQLRDDADDDVATALRRERASTE